MAVVQISKIQIRRGKKNSDQGLPQLSSGELGWAIDSQELYIGNGAVSEGAPYVGNTKVLTEHDSLFEVANRYIYKKNDGSVVTGPDAANPVTRTLQERLDDIVNGKAFGLTGLPTQNATVFLQRAVDELFLNNRLESTTETRVVLQLDPGLYIINDSIKIPPHATIIGAGKDKTIIKQEGANRPVFVTVSDESTNGSYIYDGEFATQPRNIVIDGMTLSTELTTVKGFVLQSCRDSVFRNLKIVGPWQPGDAIPADSSATTGIAFEINNKNGGIESAKNLIENVDFLNYPYGVVSNWDTNDFNFENCNFETLGYGVALGKDLNIDGNVGNGTAYGPQHYTISNSFFKNINNQAILVQEGTYNKSTNNRFITCGNDAGSDDMPVTSIIKFNKLGNESIGDYFSRTKVLSYTQGTIITGNTTITAGQTLITVNDTSNIRPGQILIKESGTGELANIDSGVGVVQSVDSPTQFSVTQPHSITGTLVFRIESPIITNIIYVPEIEGPVNATWGFEHQLTIQAGSNLTLFRLPQVIDQSFDIDYIANAIEGYNGVRSGQLNLTIDKDSNSVVVTDDYTYVGDTQFDQSLKIDAILVDLDSDLVYDTVLVKTYTTAPLPSNARTSFKFKVKNKQA